MRGFREDRGVVVTFIGKPRRIDDRGGGMARAGKALVEIGFDRCIQAEQRRRAPCPEGAADPAILQASAVTLRHPAAAVPDAPFVRFVQNDAGRAKSHFFGLREAVPDLRGFALFDRLDHHRLSDFPQPCRSWRRREVEDCIALPTVLLRRAAAHAERGWRDLHGSDLRNHDTRSSEELPPGGLRHYPSEVAPGEPVGKSDFRVLAAHVPPEEIDSEAVAVLDAMAEHPGGGAT